MGTSSARKAPVGKFWRLAKTSMARFASGKEASPPQVKEVVAGYLAALSADADCHQEDKKNFLPAIIETAGRLGNFYRRWEKEGWEEAAASHGFDPAAGLERADIIPALLETLSGPGAVLAEAVCRAALIDHLEAFPPVRERFTPEQPSDLSTKISHFVGLALYRKLVSDLGESLEFHSPGSDMAKQRQEAIRTYLLEQTQSLGPAANLDVAVSPDRIRVALDHILSQLGGRHER